MSSPFPSPPPPPAPAPGPPPGRPSRWLRALGVVILIELGLLLLIAPWTPLWPELYPLRWPGLNHILLSPYFRGAVSGLGLVDLWWGTSAIVG